MDGEILDTVTEWGTRSVGDGVSGLYDLADAGFSGAVTDGTVWAFFLNGRVVGVFDGDIDDLEDASLTAHTAPDISLPLLYAMQAGGGETRGQYYSNETPLSELDETLSAGNFVGYVELSENVLSGDYYVVYYGGRSLPVAFVGNEPRLLTGDEAFDRAADEVGIYAVIDADVTVVDLPDRPEPAGEGSGGAAGTSVNAGTDTDEDLTIDGTTTPETNTDGRTDRSPANATGDDGATGVVSADTAVDDGDGMSADAADAPDDEMEPEDPDVDLQAAMENSTGETASSPLSTETDAADTADASAEPKPDHDESSVGGPAPDGAEAPSTDVSEAGTGTGTGTESTQSPDLDPESEPESDVATADASTPADTSDEAERLRRELADARDALAEAKADRDEYRAEVERLRDRVERLEATADTPTGTERTLAPAEALSRTNLFVRYDDKSSATIEHAAAGRVPQEELRANLRIDYHTEFETGNVRVDGRSFETFLRGTTEHRFTEWLLTELLYEIRRVDAQSDVSKLFEAIEGIDRIDIDGEVSVDGGSADVDADTDAGEETMSFDVVCRGKMGAPLFVADFSDSRDPTRVSTIESMLDRTTPVAESNESLAAATVVTTSFFDADAMEAAVDATRGGLFSRSSQRSYVKLSRKHGFHLCLVEARDEDFFLTVPDL
ncbi:FtsB family cell division protein [Haloplanus sp.]|uniref:FtsB family cell division protein n=1 Tax=Haloplanus sp. TaxID=1961696 RepID=UPI002614273C|nr:hypothetical protein [Haloplanus sp.]